MSGCTGNITVTDGLTGSTLLTARVEYAVYSSDVFHGLFGVVVPSNEYVYCYQAFDFSSPTSKKAITKFNVGLGTPGVGALVTGIGEFNDASGPAGTASTSRNFVGAGPLYTSATWSYSSTNIALGGNSATLFFASPEPPTVEPVTVSSGAYAASGSVASPSTPVPEPPVLLSLMIASGFYIFVRRIWSAS